MITIIFIHKIFIQDTLQFSALTLRQIYIEMLCAFVNPIIVILLELALQAVVPLSHIFI